MNVDLATAVTGLGTVFYMVALLEGFTRTNITNLLDEGQSSFYLPLYDNAHNHISSQFELIVSSSHHRAVY